MLEGRAVGRAVEEHSERGQDQDLALAVYSGIMLHVLPIVSAKQAWASNWSWRPRFVKEQVSTVSTQIGREIA